MAEQRGKGSGKESERVFSLENISWEWPAFGRGVLILPFTVEQGQTISPGAEQKHFSLQSSKGAGCSIKPSSMIIKIKARRANQRNSFPWIQNKLPPCNKGSRS